MKDELIEGIVCTIVGQWLEIDFLWVREDQRGKGFDLNIKNLLTCGISLRVLVNSL